MVLRSFLVNYFIQFVDYSIWTKSICRRVVEWILRKLCPVFELCPLCFGVHYGSNVIIFRNCVHLVFVSTMFWMSKYLTFVPSVSLCHCLFSVCKPLWKFSSFCNFIVHPIYLQFNLYLFLDFAFTTISWNVRIWDKLRLRSN